jgi:hypothetical protein
MIGFFPESYPDELLFSLLSRYHRRTGYRDVASTMRDLFGNQMIRPSVDLTANLGELVSRLPHGHTYSVDRLIDSHTLLPFYSSFVPARRLEQIRADMEGSGGARIHSRLGINTFKGTPRTLKYCPGCVEQDRSIFGEIYWHRLHQAAGVEVCPTHQCYLIDTGVELGTWGTRDVLMAAEEAIDKKTSRQKERDQHFPIHLRIAEGAAWLLQNPMRGSGALGHRERYLELFFQRGACTYSGAFNSSFFEEVREFYSDDFLESIHCPFTRTDHWAQRLVRKEGRTQHPLYHLLLVNFLGLTIQEFFDLPATRLAFGVGPWPCLNAANQHFGEALITSYETSITQRNGRTPRGTFRCGCGFAYSRIGPEKNEEERYHLHRYVTFGDEWDSCVRELFHSGKYTRKTLALTLHMAQHTLERQLVRLGLITRQAQRATTSDRRRKPVTAQIAAQIRRKNRELFLAAAKTHPGRTAIRKAVSTADTWLRKNDKEWWEANAPSRIYTKPTAHVDWQERDSKWSVAVSAEAERILNVPGRPVFISKTAIARHLKINDVVIKRPDKVPLTMRVLQDVCEDSESFAVRRVRWAAQYFGDCGICPTRSELCSKAGITGQLKKTAKVVAEVAAALAQFHSHLGLHCDVAA